MNHKSTTSLALRLTTLFMSLCGFFIFSHQTYAAIGQDISINMYDDLDREYNSLYTKLLENNLKGINQTINKNTNGICKKDGVVADCFKTGPDFTVSELESIARGEFSAMMTKADAFSPQNTQDLTKLQEIISTVYNAVKKEVLNNQKNLGEISLIGLYTDGSLDNSSFDLMYDLTQIHKVIFSEAISYDGYENESGQGMIDLFSGIFDTKAPIGSTSTGGTLIDNGTIPLGIGGTGSGGGTHSASGGSSNTSSTSLLANCDPTSLINVDSGLYSDIGDQLENGNNTASSTSGLPDGVGGTTGTGSSFGSGQSLPPPAQSSRNVPRNNKLTDSFPCNTFFCIRVNMLIYQQKLLSGGSGKTFTIESILDKNFKIVDKFAGNSLIQTKMTKNFFESSFKNLNLGNRVHLGVMVTSKPTEILNLPGKGAGNNDQLNEKSGDTSAQILQKTFEDYCMNFKQQNNLHPTTIEQDAENMKLAELSTFDGAQRATNISLCNPNKLSYSESIRSEFRTDYYQSFDNDLMILQNFSTKLREHTINIISLIKAMYAKK